MLQVSFQIEFLVLLCLYELLLLRLLSVFVHQHVLHRVLDFRPIPLLEFFHDRIKVFVDKTFRFVSNIDDTGVVFLSD